eukprot:gene2541-biopygen2035
MDPQLDVLAELLVEGLVVLLVLGNLLEQLQRLLHNVLADHLENLVLLEILARNIQGKLAVNHALDESGQSGHRSSQLSIMNTRRTYSLMLLRFLLGSNMSNGARFGMNRMERNSS